MNNFLKLQEDDESYFNEEPANDRICQEIEGQLCSLRFLGSIFNMYLPVMADTVANVAGGGQIEPLAKPLPPADPQNPKAEKPAGPGPIDLDPIR